MDEADAHRSCITVRIVIENDFGIIFVMCAKTSLSTAVLPSVPVRPQKDGAVPSWLRTDGTVDNTGCMPEDLFSSEGSLVLGECEHCAACQARHWGLFIDVIH
jgi:hypothetical protein